MVDGFDFDEKWRMLRQRFVARLGEREREIQAAWDQVREGRDSDGAARNALFHQVHSLSGSGATFGFAELSAAARLIEPIIDPARVPPERTLDPGVLEKVEDLIARLVYELQVIPSKASS